MPHRVTDEWLEQICGGRLEEVSEPRAYWVAQQMGPLAPWWLRPEVLQKARSYAFWLHGQTEETRKKFSYWEPARQPPQESGCCWPLVVNRRPEQLGLLLPAFVFPVRWVKDQPHDKHLPTGLCELADRVTCQLRREKEIDAKAEWGLRPFREGWLQEYDLSALDWEWESAWAVLAAGLLLAHWEGSPDPTVWATGAYRVGQGICEVEGIGPKALAAWQMGVKMLFVPPGQEEEAHQFFSQERIQANLEILSLPSGPVELRKCLEPYLARLEVPPGLDATPERRKEYFLRIPDDETARRYYREWILPEVRKQKAPDLPELKLTCLVIIVSQSYDLVELAVGLVQPQRSLLLFNEEMKQECQSILTRLKEMGLECACVPRQFMNEKHGDLVQEFRQAISEFLGQTPPEQLIVDLTAGQKIMSLALYDAAPEGCFVMCCQTRMAKNSRRPVPFEEKIDYWKVARHRKI
ncbi:MAG: hypothetical protein NZ602_12705 [Thermoguttaceae bacterium]|nr:hypothetical protein [Thermoguttaceae bacterium]MDW8039642.1 hypothetical protein [Thermoguttaceae bacterium]